LPSAIAITVIANEGEFQNSWVFTKPKSEFGSEVKLSRFGGSSESEDTKGEKEKKSERF